MSKLNIWQNSRTLRLGLVLTFSLALLIGLLLAMDAARPSDVALAQGPVTRYAAPAPIGSDSGNDCITSTAPCATVQHAVDVADPGDEIRVVEGDYTDVQARAGITQVVYISKTVTVRGGYTTTNWSMPYPITQPTTLDAQKQGRVLYITGGISPTIEGLHITGGDAVGLDGSPWGDAGGGVYAITATVIMSNNQVFSNTATAGGGLYFCNSANATLIANTISDNVGNHTGGGMKGYGGVLFYRSDNATLIGNTISGNRAPNWCAGVCFSSSDNAVLMDNAIISNTKVQGYLGWGVGVYFTASKNSSLISNTISNNTGKGTTLGGGLYIGPNSTVVLTANTISSNGATRGGGLYAGSNSTVVLMSNIITGNAVYDSSGHSDYDPVGYGGGLYLNNSATTLTNTVVSDNRAETAGSGSGLYIVRSSPQLLHTTIARNSGGDGSGVYITGTLNTVALTNTILVSHTVGITVTAGNTATLNGVLWYSNTINYGGMGTITVTNEYTGTPAFTADGYHLTLSSEAIDKGVDAGVTKDIDGYNRPCGLAPDLGADEINCLYLPVILKNSG